MTVFNSSRVEEDLLLCSAVSAAIPSSFKPPLVGDDSAFSDRSNQSVRVRLMLVLFSRLRYLWSPARPVLLRPADRRQHIGTVACDMMSAGFVSESA